MGVSIKAPPALRSGLDGWSCRAVGGEPPAGFGRGGSKAKGQRIANRRSESLDPDGLAGVFRPPPTNFFRRLPFRVRSETPFAGICHSESASGGGRIRFGRTPRFAQSDGAGAFLNRPFGWWPPGQGLAFSVYSSYPPAFPFPHHT